MLWVQGVPSSILVLRPIKTAAGHNTEVQLRLTDPLEPKTRPRTRHDDKVEQEKYFVPTGAIADHLADRLSRRSHL